MSTTTLTGHAAETLADLISGIGVGPDRIRCQPPPGTAMEVDVIRLCDANDYCELIDGVLVEKAMGQRESVLAIWIGHFLLSWIERGNDLGIVHGPDAPHRLLEGQIRYPDVAFVRYERLPKDMGAEEPIASWAPNLAVEIISAGNTSKEMSDKLTVYFDAGVEVVWYVYPENRTVDVFTALDQKTTFTAEEDLDGGTLLPGFTLSHSKIFDKIR